MSKTMTSQINKAGLGGMVKVWESRRRLDFPSSAVLSQRKDPEKVNGPGSLRNPRHISKE